MRMRRRVTTICRLTNLVERGARFRDEQAFEILADRNLDRGKELRRVVEQDQIGVGDMPAERACARQSRSQHQHGRDQQQGDGGGKNRRENARYCELRQKHDRGARSESVNWTPVPRR